MRVCKWGSSLVLLLALSAALMAQSNIDNTIPNKFVWNEATGWSNWRDANGGTQGVVVGPSFLSGFIWDENTGNINVGDGTPGSICAGLPCYANLTGADFGVNIDAAGYLHGYAWSESGGWLNFDGGALATPPQPARIICASPPGQPLARLTGYVWRENFGWKNLSEVTLGKFVSLDLASTPLACDMNGDGDDNGADVQLFVSLMLYDGASWRDVCSGDVEPLPDGALDFDDVADFVQCLLTKP